MKLEAKCQKHWDKIGISNLETLQTYIKGIFRKHDHQEKILIDLYKMVLPDWDRIKKSGVIPKQAMRFGNSSAGDSLSLTANTTQTFLQVVSG